MVRWSWARGHSSHFGCSQTFLLERPRLARTLADELLQVVASSGLPSVAHQSPKSSSVPTLTAPAVDLCYASLLSSFSSEPIRIIVAGGCVLVCRVWYSIRHLSSVFWQTRPLWLALLRSPAGGRRLLLQPGSSSVACCLREWAPSWTTLRPCGSCGTPTWSHWRLITRRLLVRTITSVSLPSIHSAWVRTFILGWATSIGTSRGIS